MLGAAWIADRALLPAIRDSANGFPLALAARDRGRAAEMAGRHGVERVHGSYEALLADPDVDAVYIPLPNHLHLPWTVAALAAGKHVLCEKPIGLDAAEAVQMAAAAGRHRRLLMEAAMYRFHPAMRALSAEVAGDARYVHATFAFPLDAPGNYRLSAAFGGGALLDVGFYCVDVARWILGEPDRVVAVWRRDEVDMSVAAALSFPGGAEATVYAGFEAPEYQELVVVTGDRVVRAERPFTSRTPADDPYRNMVEEFGAAILGGGEAPLALESSIATMRVLDRIRAAAEAP